VNVCRFVPLFFLPRPQTMRVRNRDPNGIRLACLAMWLVVMQLGLAGSVLAADSVPIRVGTEAGSLSWIEAVVLGAVEGFTEYLPISSTGHLILVQRWMGLEAGEQDAANAFAICIQIGAILAVLWLYFGRFRQVFRGLTGSDADGLRLFRNLVIAFIPAAVLGLLFGDLLKSQLFGPRPVAVASFVGGVVILLVASKIKPRGSGDRQLEAMTWQQSLVVGVIHCLALFPGFSRSLAAILGCTWIGLELTAAVEFSFLLGLVTLTAATAYEGLAHGAEIVSQYGVLMPLLSIGVAFGTAILSVRFMLRVLGRWGLAPFGYYRIALSALILLWF
jgi:undecaprenyl-diphosphatase